MREFSEQELVSTINFIKANDGIAVIAHPIHYKNTSSKAEFHLDNWLSALKKRFCCKQQNLQRISV